LPPRMPAPPLLPGQSPEIVPIPISPPVPISIAGNDPPFPGTPSLGLLPLRRPQFIVRLPPKNPWLPIPSSRNSPLLPSLPGPFTPYPGFPDRWSPVPGVQLPGFIPDWLQPKE
jgi:hypothetical protein